MKTTIAYFVSIFLFVFSMSVNAEVKKILAKKHYNIPGSQWILTHEKVDGSNEEERWVCRIRYNKRDKYYICFYSFLNEKTGFRKIQFTVQYPDIRFLKVKVNSKWQFGWATRGNTEIFRGLCHKKERACVVRNDEKLNRKRNFFIKIDLDDIDLLRNSRKMVIWIKKRGDEEKIVTEIDLVEIDEVLEDFRNDALVHKQMSTRIKYGIADFLK